MSYENDYYAPSGSGQNHQQSSSSSHQAEQQLLANQSLMGSTTNADTFQSPFYADPRYQVPPNFLDNPPRGPDVQGFTNGSSQYLLSQQIPTQDPSSWANYLRLPTGLTPPAAGQRSDETSPVAYQASNLSNGGFALPSSSAPEGLEDHSYGLGSSLARQNEPNAALSPHGETNVSALAVVRPGSNSSLQPPSLQRNDTPPTAPGPLLYSSSGFDMIGVLARVANRKNPQVVLGPVDFTCSFVVSDATKPDEPIVYCSPTFTELTGYPMDEIVGRNCRFLQSPSGRIRKGETRRFTDDRGVAHIRKSLDNGQECQVSFINYKKNGEAFVNLVTIIPIAWDDSEEMRYLIGFQVDLEAQPGAILRTMNDGSYAVNYSTSAVDPYPPVSDRLKGILGLNDSAEESRQIFNDWVLDHADDFIHVVSLKGVFQYVSPSVLPILEYTPEELAGKNITDIAHPSDVVPIMRELKESSAQPQPPSMISSSTLAQHYLSQAKLVHLLYRVKRKESGFVWLESIGRLHVESSKGRKSIVFSGRIRRSPSLSWGLIVRGGGAPAATSSATLDCWAQISVDNGLLLSVSTGALHVLGRPAPEVQGTRLRDWVKSDARSAVDAAIAQAREKLRIPSRSSSPSATAANGSNGAETRGMTTITCLRAVPDANAIIPPITLTFYSSPGSLASESSSLSASMPQPALVDIPPSSTSPFTFPTTATSARILRGARQSTMVVHIRFFAGPLPSPARTIETLSSESPTSPNPGDMNIDQPMSSDGPSSHAAGSSTTDTPSIAVTASNQPQASTSSSAPVASSSNNHNNNNMAPPQEKILSASLDANLFEELETTRGTSWQYEMQQLRIANSKLRAEIDTVLKQQQQHGSSLGAGMGMGFGPSMAHSRMW